MDQVYELLILSLVSFLCVGDVLSWPDGSYGLPMPATNCPEAKDFDWETGDLIEIALIMSLRVRSYLVCVLLLLFVR